MVTRVFPLFGPEEGRTAVTDGVDPDVVPKAKQLGIVSTTGLDVFVPNVRLIVTGTEGDCASGKAGVRTLTVEPVTSVTRASRVTPAAVNVARVVPAVPKKRPPFKVTAVPPVFGAKLGLQEEKNGPAWAEGWKEITSVPVPVWVPTVAVARTLARPAFAEQRAVNAAPP